MSDTRQQLDWFPVTFRGVFDVPRDEDLQIINARVSTPLTAAELFVFDMTASTDALDTYFTHMDPDTTLNNYSVDLAAGRSLLDSHDVFRLPIGVSFRAEKQAITEAEGVVATARVLAGYYMIRGLDVAGTNTDQYIRGVQTGVYNRGSIGFGGPFVYICDQNGMDLFDDANPLYPGQRLRDGTYVTYTIKHARAQETSIVTVNSTPGAIVERVQDMVGQRQIPASDLHRLESRWNVRFAGKPPQHFVKGPSRMDEKELARSALDGINTRIGKKLSQKSRDRLSGAVDGMSAATEVIVNLLEETADDAEAGRMVRTALGGEITAERISTLTSEAEAGRAWRTSLIDETIQARTASEGEAFTKERADKFRQRLERSSIEDIQDDHATWSAKRASTFTSGRQIPVGDVRGGGQSGTVPMQTVEE